MAGSSGTDRGIVWVLGAGFSKALGGPLLTELLSEPSAKDLELRYGDDVPAVSRNSPTNALVRWLFRYGLPSSVNTGALPRLDRQGSAACEPLWDNAENFIEYLDLATVEEGAHAIRARRLYGIQREQGIATLVKMQDLWDAARRLVAAECSGFLESADPWSEKWLPFRRWADDLRPHDTVLTFNYDLVLETIADSQKVRAPGVPARTGGPSMGIVLPKERIDWTEDRCPVVKLHGSVNWTRIFDDGMPVEIREAPSVRAVLDGDAKFFALATPGPTKMSEARAPFSFKGLWDFAGERIRRAGVIVFVGFRFPESDAHPRRALLSAIRENTAREDPGDWMLRLHIVLGDADFAAKRLQSMLRFVGPRRRTGGHAQSEAYVHPLFAQDFLDVFERDYLFAPAPV
jgi:hypothetical protein